MAQAIYTKYNKLRQKDFRTRTCIYEDSGGRWVEKTALCPEAETHVNQLAERRKQLIRKYPELDFVEADTTERGVRFAYLTGETLDSFLVRSADTAQSLTGAFERIFSRILPEETGWEPFHGTPGFDGVFGEAKGMEGRAAASFMNMDCLLDNIVVNGEDLVCLDYEWVFDFAVPVDFIRYRVIHYFYQAHPETARLIGEADLLARLGLSAEDTQAFAAMELKFQHYVFGGEKDCRYTENYRKPVTTYDQMTAEKQQNLREIEELRKVVGHYEGVERKLRKIGLWQALQGV